MSRSTQAQFPRLSPTSGGAILAYTIPAGGSVRVQVPQGEGRVDLFNMTASGAINLHIYTCDFWVVPAGGATYTLHM